MKYYYEYYKIIVFAGQTKYAQNYETKNTIQKKYLT